MPKISAFEKNPTAYDQWFTTHKKMYLAELQVIKQLVPIKGIGVEIGVGTGNFAQPLGIPIGLEPSINMAKSAQKKGIQVVKGIAEQLPFFSNIFDFVVFIATICFLDTISRAFIETYRVLKPNGIIIVGFINEDSILAAQNQRKKEKSKFYQEATFYSTKKIIDMLRANHFKQMVIKQTLFIDVTMAVDTIQDGYNKGNFIVIKANKTNQEKEDT